MLSCLEMEFPTTRWTLVLAAGQEQEGGANEALLGLCEHYWYPLYAFLRRKGYSSDHAQDLVQGFFLKLIEKRYLQSADQSRGRFRSFLLASLLHYVSNQHDHDRAVKRGGTQPVLSLDIPRGEAQLAAERLATVDVRTPEQLYEAEWAYTLIDRVLRALEEEWAKAGKQDQFAICKPLLSGAATTPYAELAVRLGISEGNVKVVMHRLRKRFGQRLRDEIAVTVDQPDQVEDELRFLLSAVSL